MPNHRIGEHVRAVAKRRDDEFVRRRKLGAQCRTETPAKPAGGAEREQRVRLVALDLRGAQGIFVEDHSIGTDGFADAARQIFRRDRLSGRGILRKLRAPCAHALGQARAAGGDARLRHLQPRPDRGVESGQRVDGAGLDREIAREGAHRVAHEERLLANVHDVTSRGRVMQAGDPGRIAVNGDDEVGVGQQRARFEAEMHGVA